MKPLIKQVKINEPCSEDWNRMTPLEQGRHCDRCAKQVVDFTQMSDKGIMDHLRQNPGTCGRFNNHQLERDIMVYPEIPTWQSRLSKLAASIFILAQLFPKKAVAKSIPSYPIEKTIVLADQVNEHIAINKLVRCKITQPPQAIDRAVKMVFCIDTINREINFDSLSAGEFNFMIPDSLKYGKIKVSLFTIHNMYELEMDLQEDYRAALVFATNTHHFYFEKAWAHRAERVILPFITYRDSFYVPQVTGGLPYIYPPFPKPIKMQGLWKSITAFTPVLFKDTVPLKDTVLKIASAPVNAISKESLSKVKVWKWWWLVFVFSLSFAIRWFFNGFTNSSNVIRGQKRQK